MMAPISFRGYMIKSLIYKHIDDESELSEEEKKKFDLNSSFGYNKKEKTGVVKEKINIYNKNKKSLINLEIMANFSINEEDDDEKIKTLLAQNGSAMLYPYLRTIVSLVTALDSSDTTVLPSINFVEAYNEAKKTNNKY